MDAGYRPLVSIIVPTYNEEKDIERTLDALAAILYRPLGVIVVDKSQDRTPDIVRGYKTRIAGLRLVPQGEKPGVSAARNVGLREARGEIAVILNADVYPEPDFVDRIVAHYQQGADFLLVDSRVTNTQFLFPRYIQAEHAGAFHHGDNPVWTEGFSCRREAALAVGGFPEEFATNTAGEDAIFAGRLAAKYRRAVDFSIVVPHVMPNELSVYWRQRVGRGRGGAYMLYVHEKRPMRWGAILRSVLGTLALAAVLIPAMMYAWRVAAYSPRGRWDWLPFTWARLVDRAATAIGYWDGCREIARLPHPLAPSPTVGRGGTA